MEELGLFPLLSLLLWVAKEICVCSRREWRERTENNSFVLVLWSYILLCHQGKVRVGSAVDSSLNCLLATTLNVSLLVVLCWRVLGLQNTINGRTNKWKTCDMREITKYGVHFFRWPVTWPDNLGEKLMGEVTESKQQQHLLSIAIEATLIMVTSESIDKDFQSLLHLHRTITFLAALAVRIYIV